MQQTDYSYVIYAQNKILHNISYTLPQYHLHSPYQFNGEYHLFHSCISGDFPVKPTCPRGKRFSTQVLTIFIQSIKSHRRIWQIYQTVWHLHIYSLEA